MIHKALPAKYCQGLIHGIKAATLKTIGTQVINEDVNQLALNLGGVSLSFWQPSREAKEEDKLVYSLTSS